MGCVCRPRLSVRHLTVDDTTALRPGAHDHPGQPDPGLPDPVDPDAVGGDRRRAAAADPAAPGDLTGVPSPHRAWSTRCWSTRPRAVSSSTSGIGTGVAGRPAAYAATTAASTVSTSRPGTSRDREPTEPSSNSWPRHR